MATECCCCWVGLGWVGCWCWVLGVGCWVLGVGCWVLGVGCWVLVLGVGVGGWLGAVGLGCVCVGVGVGGWVVKGGGREGDTDGNGTQAGARPLRSEGSNGL